MIKIPERLLLARIVDLVFTVFYWVLLARIIFSFLPLGRDANPTLLQIRGFAFRLTEPVLAPFRSIIKPVHMGGGGYLDLSPILALLVLGWIKRLLISLIFRF